MLYFVGLGLFDINDISVKGHEIIKNASLVVIDGYTSRLIGTSFEELSEHYQKEIKVLAREDVEQYPDFFIKTAGKEDVCFLTGGDPMVSTTHMDLRIRAEQAGVKTVIIHGSSIVSAVCGLSGLQNYRFGKSCSVPYPSKHWFPLTSGEIIHENQRLNLHTLVYLDIQPNRFMSVAEAVEILEEISKKLEFSIPLYVGIARAGSKAPVVIAGDSEVMKKSDFGGPLHILIVPGNLHPMEEEYLTLFAGLNTNDHR